MEWFVRIVEWLLGGLRSKREDSRTKREEDRKDFDTLTEAFHNLNSDHVVLMKNYMQMNQELLGRLEAMENKVEALASELEREKGEHRACRERLGTLETRTSNQKLEIDDLKKKLHALTTRVDEVDEHGTE